MLQFLLLHMAEFSPSVTLKIFLWIYVDGGMQIDTFCFKVQIKRRHADGFCTYIKDGQNMQIGTTCILTQIVPGKTGFLFIIAGSCARMPFTCHRSLRSNREGSRSPALGYAAVNTFF